MSATTAADWDTRVAHFLTKLPPRARSAVGWLRHPRRRWLRLIVAMLLIVGGILSILPLLGLWMLPLGLALMSDDVPGIKPWLERSARWIETAWQWGRAGWRNRGR